MNDEVDLLMITYNRPEYTELSLRRLLETSDEKVRVWLWHNGDHQPTLNVIKKYENHPRLHEFHHSKENVKLTEPTNWLWKNAVGSYVGKVDDDCLVSSGWIDTLRQAHEDEPKFGILGCWIYLEEDFIPKLAMKKISTFGGGHKIMQNCWIGGSGYLMKRACIDEAGLIDHNLSFTQYGKNLARAGWIHGWYYPFLYHEHMDDPRSDHSLLRTDEDLNKYLPLSAQKSGVKSLVEWQNRLARSARELQSAPIEPKYHFGWRRKLRGIRDRLLESNSY